LNITISGYGDNLGFGYIACRRSVPALQRMLDYTHNAINELENALGLETLQEPKRKAPSRSAKIAKTSAIKTARTSHLKTASAAIRDRKIAIE
jgi:diacylglycerol O-acyltransferase